MYDVDVLRQATAYRLRVREGTDADVTQLVDRWAPMLERGPLAWLDREWAWSDLTARSELAFPIEPTLLVLVDEADPSGNGDVLGVLVTTGPVPADVSPAEIGAPVVWVENVAIAPWHRRDCPARERTEIVLKPLGPQLMLAAIRRSEAVGCDGRIGLHAEGRAAATTYEAWGMARLADAPHAAGGAYPVFYGSEAWASGFKQRRKGSP